jgi:CHAD domain-containing protein
MSGKKAKPARYTEVERKFEVVDATVSPSFEGLSAVSSVERRPVEQLDAVYYDTPGHDLAAHRITLRRRTGGTDAGWHLKLPAGPDARTEVRAPLGDGDADVPDELRDIVLAIVRDRPLAPVARISTERTIDMLHDANGNPIAEFCDDRVTASAGDDGPEQHWREWELELTEHAQHTPELLDRLANRLLDAGAGPASHGSKLARVLDTGSGGDEEVSTRTDDPVHRAVAELVDDLVAWDRAVRDDVEDSVHQMRVTTRKIRSLLQASEPAFGISDDAWVLDELRQLAGLLGVARDAEVLAEKYEKALDSLPSELVRGPVRERLVDGARRRYEAGRRRSLVAMRSQRYFRLLDALDGLVSADPAAADDGSSAEPVTIDRSYKRIRKAAKKAGQATGHERDESLHKIRKRAKQLRYTAAATGSAKVSDKAKAVQSLLGDHQDSVVSRTHLSEQAAAAHAAGEDTFTYGVLYRLEDEIAQSAEEELDDVMSSLHKAVRKAGKKGK